ncbi:MAG TPA: histidinol-phosphatase [Firmicutes bacterium]|uniref:Histidinol-phosphatase n=1 Tax=Capillibacterium thermochitinicola TaxID=2699427 RepID=A0A8J6I157_9FIRM|nr:histidinol-phosphatase [Capillibacterium thermochitinicola]MBA2133840.1 histidinol-phosphatase [Capillibacterium thermochitinicola]HHW11635.1 histidinol-phosphatase [Bacillota bacterium]
MRQDYHTHTYRCKHADADVVDYAAVAVQKGLGVLGVTDHTPLPFLPDTRWSMIRMDLSELDSYDQAVEKARVTYPELTILKGMECEYSPEYSSFYREELLGKRKFDYLIAGNHFVPYNGSWVGVHSYLKSKEALLAYADHMVETIASGLFAFIAHPDLFGNSYEFWDEHAIECAKRILEAAAAYKVPLEVNAYGLRKPMLKTTAGLRPPYPLSPFWELAAGYKGITVVANSDAHQPKDVGETAAVERLIDQYGLRRADLSSLANRTHHRAPVARCAGE